MLKSRARLWVTSSTAASTSSPLTSSSTSALFSRRTSRTCCCESELFFALGNACEYHYFHLIWLSSLVLSSRPSPLLHDFCFRTRSSVIHTMGKWVHLWAARCSSRALVCCDVLPGSFFHGVHPQFLQAAWFLSSFFLYISFWHLSIWALCGAKERLTFWNILRTKFFGFLELKLARTVAC